MKSPSSFSLVLKTAVFAWVMSMIPVHSAQPWRTFAEAVNGGSYFKQRLVPVGPTLPSEAESQVLFEVLTQWRVQGDQAGLPALEKFVEEFPDSAWAPSIRINLGHLYRERGRYTLALQHWEEAWEATKRSPGGDDKRVADYALAHWTRLLASLGRFDELTWIYLQHGDRELDGGPLSQRWRRTREAYAIMWRNPEVSFKCGLYALNQVGLRLGVPSFRGSEMTSIGSPTNGFTLGELGQIASQYGIAVVPVAREMGSEIVVPSVVHWKQEHYAAIVSQVGNVYEVVDRTFGTRIWMDAETLNAEASGYFLVPAGVSKLGYRGVTPVEAELVRGKGYSYSVDDPSDQPPSCPPAPGSGSDNPQSGSSIAAGDGNQPGSGSGSGSSGKGNGGDGKGGKREIYVKKRTNTPQGCMDCTGMPVWRVSEPYINLWLHDEPLGYQPSRGRRVSFLLSAKQRDEDAGSILDYYSSVGYGWNCNWLSYIWAGPLLTYGVGNVTLYRADGGRTTFFFDTGQDNSTRDYFSNQYMTKIKDGSGNVIGLELLYSDGAKDVFGFGRTNLSGVNNNKEFYLSKKVADDGTELRFDYPSYDPDEVNGQVVLLGRVVDTDGRTNTLAYGNGSFPTLITSVVDPFSRTNFLTYDSNPRITNITDVAGLSSQFRYDASGWITNLITPYGTTVIQSSDLGEDLSLPYNRFISITEPTGGKHQYLSDGNNANLVQSYPSSVIPTNTPLNTLDTIGRSTRNTFYWNPYQSAGLSTSDPSSFSTNDFNLGRRRHWLGEEYSHDVNAPLNTLSVQQDPSPDGINEGQLTWYDYDGKVFQYEGDQGTQSQPAVIARVLPNGSTWYIWYRLNSWGLPTNIVETYTKLDGTIGTRTNSYGYASNGIDVLTVTNALGVRVSSNYFNAYHQVLTNYNASNEATIFTYNANRQLTSVKTPAGLTTTNFYFSGGSYPNFLEKTIDLEITRTNSYTYLNNLVATHTDERGLTTTNTYDSLQRLTGISFPDGSTLSNKYTKLDLTSTKDRLSNWSYFGYDSVRRLIAATNANSIVTRYGYCECGGLTYLTNAFGNALQEVTSYSYDYQGNRLYTLFADGAKITNWFDSLQRLIATTDGAGTKWLGYNNQGLLTTITNGVGVELRTLFDSLDRAYSSSDANGVAVTNTYDNLNRPLTRTYPDGGAEKWGYSAGISSFTKYTNQLNNIWQFAYDAAGRTTNEIAVGIHTNKLTFSAATDLKTLTDGKNQTTTWNYDLYGRVTNKLDQTSVEILRYLYDANGRLTNLWSKAKTNTVFSYDAIGNVTNINYPVSADVTYKYDALNRMTNITDATGSTKFTYYAGGLLNTEDGPWSSDTVTYTYTNRLVKSLSIQQPTGSWTNGFTYDAAKRLSNVLASAGTFTYTYQTPGLLVKKLALPNTSYITNTFDSVGRTTSTKLNNSSHTTLDKMDYLYNSGNQRIKATRTDASYYTNNYDSIGQLKWADSTVAAEDRGYLYDAAWNVTTRTNNGSTTAYTVDGKNQLTNYAGTTFVHDNNGNLTGTGAGNTYLYDDENQLIALFKTNSARTEFVYDGMGRMRVAKQFTWKAGDSSWDPTGETRYIYWGMRVIQERNSANTPTVSYTRGSDLSGSFEGAGGIGGMLSRSHAYQSGSGSFTNHNYYHADGNGNITYLVNTNQTEAASYRYDPFGNTISSSGTLASANTYRFSSKELTALNLTNSVYYYGYRFYDPNLQRWLNRDPIEEDGGINLYTFVWNDPGDWVDDVGNKGSSYPRQPTRRPDRQNLPTSQIPIAGRSPGYPYTPTPLPRYCIRLPVLDRNLADAWDNSDDFKKWLDEMDKLLRPILTPQRPGSRPPPSIYPLPPVPFVPPPYSSIPGLPPGWTPPTVNQIPKLIIVR